MPLKLFTAFGRFWPLVGTNPYVVQGCVLKNIYLSDREYQRLSFASDWSLSSDNDFLASWLIKVVGYGVQLSIGGVSQHIMGIIMRCRH